MISSKLISDVVTGYVDMRSIEVPEVSGEKSMYIGWKSKKPLK